MRSQPLLLGLAFGARGWEDWLRNFGHDTFVYPSWVAQQKAACDCSVDFASGPRLVSCSTQRADGGTIDVEWRNAQDIDFCVAKHWLLEHMPDFDLHYLPPSISVDGDSMLDDNIAFTLMALEASALDPEPPLEVRLGYLLPYAAFHEARANWRPIFFAKFFGLAQGLTSTREMVTQLIQSTEFMNWTGHYWGDSPRTAADDASYKVVWSSSTNPPVVAPFDMIAYGYGSCTAWSTFLTSALKSVGVPARQAGSPCWNTGQFQGLASENPNVTECWTGGPPGNTGGAFLNNHNWVEWWDNEVQDWSFMDVPPGNAPSRDTWWCGSYTPEGGCSCSSNGGSAMRDHPVVSATWDLVGEGATVNGGEVLNIAELQLSNGQRASPLSWAPNLASPLGRRLADVGLRMVNRTEFYRCKEPLAGSAAVNI